MKRKYILALIVVVGMSFFSCDDNKMNWHKDPSHGDITSAELPLQLAEKISRYDVLKSYADLRLGIGIGLSMYMENEAYRKLVNENFHEVTVGYEMKHGPMVNAQGEINFSKVDDFIQEIQSAGLGLYGHTLVWHSNQNASYLNGLIAPTIIPDPAGSNLLDLTGLKDGSLSKGWVPQNKGAGLTVVDGKGLTATSKAVELKSSASSSSYWSLQLITPEIIAIEGHTYEVSFYIRSEQPGKGRISFNGLDNNYPWKDWNGSGSGKEAFETTSQWQQIKFTVNDFKDPTFKMNFDLGVLPDVTYYIDVDNIVVLDLDAAPTFVNLITNSDFESGSLSPWGSWGNDSKSSISAQGEGYGGKGYSMVLENPKDASSYSAQAGFTLKTELKKDQKYKATAMVKSSIGGGSIQMQVQNAAYGGQYSGGKTIGTTWTQIEWEFTASSADRSKLLFDFGEKAATYYVDDVVLHEVTAETKRADSPKLRATIVEKTDEEKAELIGGAMESWVSQMVGHYKNVIKAWDVVNEPMDDGKPSSLKTGVGKAEMASDEFYWQDYLGKDYAVKAFKLARQHGNTDDILFINDYNLEYNLAKCDGLIEYVKYIESQGAKVDGIGTQMHISINTNKDNIVQMFQKLAATGKMIKITELDIKLETASPTTEQLEAQSNMYKYVIDMFKEHIPKAQQHSITIWGVSDNAAEHEYWIPNDGPNVWDKEYKRKHAYKGVADGLAGRDVSEDFTGELEY